MNIIKDSTGEVHYHTRRINFEGMPAEPWVGVSHKGKLWGPDYASAQWDHGEPIKEINVVGTILKKDGTPGQSRTKRVYVTPANRFWDKGTNGWSCRSNAPAWLLELFGIEVPA